MRYKLFASDMDGTLLLPDGSISERTKVAIGAAEEKGMRFTLVSGRPLCGVKKTIAALSLRTPVILYNGGAIYDVQTDKLIFEKTLRPTDAEKVLAYAEAERIPVCVWCKERLFANMPSEKAERYKKILEVDALPIPSGASLAREGISKILFCGDEACFARVQEKTARGDFGQTSLVCASPIDRELIPRDVSKGRALLWLADKLGIAKEEIAAVGDQENDLSMIRAAGLGIAMGNAIPALKAEAGYITEENTKDGVALAIEHVLAL